MPQITVGTSAVPIPNNGTDTLYGINVGATTLYYSQLPSVSVDSGTPLSPGNAVQGWPVGQPLYIVSSGGNGQFAYEANGSQIAIGAVAAALLPGSTVDVGNTVGVTGSVDASGSTIHSKSQNSPVNLGGVPTVFPASMGSPQPLAALPSMSVAGYSSVMVNVSDNQAGIVPSASSMIKVVITQTLNGVQVGIPINAHYLIGACNGFVQIPVIGDSVQVSGQYINQSALIGTISVQVAGSAEVISIPKYLSFNSAGKGSLASGGYYNTTTGVTVQDYVNCRNGPAELCVLAGTGTSAGSANIAVADFDNPSTPVILAGTGSVPGGGALNIPLDIPMRPVFMTTRPTSGTLIGSLIQ